MVQLDEQSLLRSGIPYNLIICTYFIHNVISMARRGRRGRNKGGTQVRVVLPNSGRSRSRSRSRSRRRAGVRTQTVQVGNRVGEQYQSAGMYRPTKDYNAPLLATGRAPMSTSFSGRRRRQATTAGSQSVGQDLPPLITAYVDPWDEDAVGIRYPDGFRGLSGTIVGNYTAALTTGGTFQDLNQVGVTPAAGTALFFLTPDPSNILIQGVSGTQTGGYYAGFPNIFAWPNGILYTNAAGSANAFGPGTGVAKIDTGIGNLDAMRQLYSSARLVAGGVKITSTMNFAAVSGTIHMAPYAYNLSKMTSTSDPRQFGGNFDPTVTEMFNGWQPALPNSLGAMSQLPGYVQYPLSSLEQDEMVAVFKRFGEEALLFKPTTTAWGMDDDNTALLTSRRGDANLPSTVGHYGVLVYINGVLTSAGTPPPNNTPILSLQYRTHYECQPSTSLTMNATGDTVFPSGGTSMCTLSPPYQPLTMAAADNIAAEVPAVRCIDDAGVEEVGFIDEVSRVWNNAVAVASSAYPAISAVAGLLSSFAI